MRQWMEGAPNPASNPIFFTPNPHLILACVQLTRWRGLDRTKDISPADVLSLRVESWLQHELLLSDFIDYTVQSFMTTTNQEERSGKHLSPLLCQSHVLGHMTPRC